MPRTIHFTAVLLAAGILFAGVAVACGEDEGEPEASPTAAAVRSPATTPTAAATTPAAEESATPGAGGGGGATTIDVELREYSVVLSENSAPAGTITFNVTNAGPNDPHEFVVIRSDLAPDALPKDEDGAVIEDEVDVVDEVEELAVGDSAELTVDLEPGKYVLICNLVEEEDGEVEAHYTLGMRTGFTVE